MFKWLRNLVSTIFDREPSPPPPPPPPNKETLLQAMRRREFEEARDRAIDVGDIVEHPDIDDYMTDYDPEWLNAWNAMIHEEITSGRSLTEGQILAYIDMLTDIPIDDWPEFDETFDYWEWYRENYKEF